MKQPSLADLAIGKSSIRRRILDLLLRDSAARYHLREIQRRAATTPGTASRELANLESAGLIVREPDRHHVYYRAAHTPLAELLRSMIEVEEASGSVGATLSDEATGREEATRHEAAPDDVEPFERRAEPSHADLGVTRSFADAMRTEFQDRLREVVLLGSRARGEAGPDYALQFLVVLDRIDSYYDEIERSSQAVNAFSLETGVVVNRTFVTDGERGKLAAPDPGLARLDPTTADAFAHRWDSGDSGDPARDLLDRAERLVDEGDGEVFEQRGAEAIGHASEACLLIAQAVLDRDGVTRLPPRRIQHAYLERFGRGGRLYAAYYRWFSDIADYAAALELGLHAAEDRGAATSIERVRLFWDAADRFVEKAREATR